MHYITFSVTIEVTFKSTKVNVIFYSLTSTLLQTKNRATKITALLYTNSNPIIVANIK